jgi:hypothetical protein
MLGGDVLHEVELVMVMRIDATIVTLPRRSRLESIPSRDLHRFRQQFVLRRNMNTL